MGTFTTGCRVENSIERQKHFRLARLLVDTGSEYTWVPAAKLVEIGVRREKKDVRFVMANGEVITRSVGFAILRVDQQFTIDEVVFAEPDDLLLLGARTLEGLNLIVDSGRKRLVAAGPVPVARSCRRRRLSASEQKLMGKLYETINPELRDWLIQQKVFFVATAPTALDGHINCSPKGGDTFRVLSDRQVAYLDLTGSGIETTAHLQENGRIVLMFCAFDGAPKIVRLHGTGRLIYPRAADFERLLGEFPSHLGVRGIVSVTVDRVSDSCGHGVPLMQFVARRDLMEKWCAAKGPAGLAEYRASKNHASIDGLKGYLD